MRLKPGLIGCQDGTKVLYLASVGSGSFDAFETSRRLMYRLVLMGLAEVPLEASGCQPAACNGVQDRSHSQDAYKHYKILQIQRKVRKHSQLIELFEDSS